MKRALVTVLVLGLLVGLLAGCGPTKVVVATDATWPPMEMVDDKTREFVGFDIDLMKAIAQEAGLEVEFRNVTWKDIFLSLSTGECDAIISSVTITDERKKDYDFSNPYINAGQVILVQADNSVINGPNDLAGKTVGAQRDTTGAMAVQKIQGATLKEYEEIGFAIEDLLAGRVDAVVCDTPVAANYATVEYVGRVKLVGAAFTDEYYGIVVKKGNSELLSRLNDGLKKVQDKGVDKQLMQKWGLPTQ